MVSWNGLSISVARAKPSSDPKKGPKFGPCLETLGGRDGDGMLVQKAGKIVVARTDLGAVVAAMGMGWAEDL